VTKQWILQGVLFVDSTNVFCARVRDLYRNGQYEQVLALTGAAPDEYADHPQRWHFRGLAHHARGEFAEAATALETLTLLAPLTPAAQVALASSYLVLGKRELARTVYEYLATESDVPVPLLPQLAAGLDCLEEFDLALAVRRQWAEREPDCAPAFFALARSMARQNYPPETLLPVLWQAFQLAPDRILYRVDLALQFTRCGQAGRAYELLHEVPAAEFRAICCPPRLHGLVALFAEAGDMDRQQACQEKLAELAENRRPADDSQ
jgi:thioredoxin-like negative regulator of GroEL